MVYRIAGGLALGVLGLSTVGVSGIPTMLIGVLLIVAGVALLAGV